MYIKFTIILISTTGPYGYHLQMYIFFLLILQWTVDDRQGMEVWALPARLEAVQTS